MYAENLEAAEEVIRRLFDPRRTYKKAYISPETSWPICSIIWKADGRRLLAKIWHAAVLLKKSAAASFMCARPTVCWPTSCI